LSDSVYTQAEATTQRTAKRKMQRERKKLQESRDGARAELDKIAEELKDPDIPKKDRNEMEERQRELLNLLAMFDTDDD
jgi:F0F1-type ATP synthase membrane subunit b/b'